MLEGRKGRWRWGGRWGCKAQCDEIGRDGPGWGGEVTCGIHLWIYGSVREYSLSQCKGHPSSHRCLQPLGCDVEGGKLIERYDDVSAEVLGWCSVDCSLVWCVVWCEECSVVWCSVWCVVCSVVWCGVVWCGVSMWCGVAWRGGVVCGVVV